MEKLSRDIPSLLLAWYEKNRRELPWRRDREPYHVWLSEIMLQQTRVEAVKGYYVRFLQELPTVEALAACQPDRLGKLWEGLGYYTRVRNLQKAAKVIVQDFRGVFPRDYAAIRSLPGVGDYTAGAVGSICFELPTPAVDGNVLRVLSRLTADDSPVTKQAVRKEYTERLAEIYPAGRCGDFTQALMELGATVCGPNREPDCENCPLAGLCAAKAQGTQMKFPVKEAKKARRIEEKTVFILRCGGKIAVRRRPDRGLLAGLWELPNAEGRLDTAEALRTAEDFGAKPKELQKMLEKTHIFTHVEWHMRGYYLECGEESPAFVWADETRFSRDIALPTAFRQFWEE